MINDKLIAARSMYLDTIELRNGSWPEGKVPEWARARSKALTGSTHAIPPTSSTILSWAADRYIEVLEVALGIQRAAVTYLTERANQMQEQLATLGTVADGANLVVTAFQIDALEYDAVSFHRMCSRDYEGVRVAVRRMGECLSIDGKWEVEPTPSSRDGAFYDRCRFASLGEAVAAYKKWKDTP